MVVRPLTGLLQLVRPPEPSSRRTDRKFSVSGAFKLRIIIQELELPSHDHLMCPNRFNNGHSINCRTLLHYRVRSLPAWTVLEILNCRALCATPAGCRHTSVVHYGLHNLKLPDENDNPRGTTIGIALWGTVMAAGIWWMRHLVLLIFPLRG